MHSMGFGAGSQVAQQNLTGWQQMQQNLTGTTTSIMDTIWSPSTSYDSVDSWREATGGSTLSIQLGSGGFPNGFDQWRSGLGAPAASPTSRNQNFESLAWLFLGLM